jgi:hypothetical protein
MPNRDSKERCTWRVTRADGALLREGGFFETDYEAAVARAKHDAAAFALPGATLTLEVGRMAIMTFRY